MKPFLSLIFSLLAFSSVVQAQTLPKGADGIEVTTSLADSVLFESVQNYLEEAGFDIDVANEEEGTLVTGYITVTDFKTIKEPVQLRVLATLENSVVLFKGQLINRLSATDNEPITNNESADDQRKGSFLFLNELVTKYAKTLDLATVEYTIP